MRDLTKYQGIIPAFYACYDDEGNVSVEKIKKFNTKVKEVEYSTDVVK